MARTRDPEVVKRNDVIFAEWVRGASLTDLGARYGLARQVVGRIVARFHPEGAEDDDRGLFRGYMWRLYDEVQEIGDHPGFKMRPDGRPAEDMDGNPALDTNVQVQAKELQLKIIRELRLLDGRDRVQRLPRVAEEEARAQAAASLAAIGTMVAEQRAEVERRHQRELEEARRSPVVLGEVVEDQERQRRGEGG